MWNNWKVGQLVRVTFTDKKFESGQSIDCQIAGVLRKSEQNTLLFAIPSFSLFLENEEEMKLLEWEYIESGAILALVKVDKEQFTGEWKATVEPLSDREPC